jgi:F-type H+-transporting ATPase subunit b
LSTSQHKPLNRLFSLALLAGLAAGLAAIPAPALAQTENPNAPVKSEAAHRHAGQPTQPGEVRTQKVEEAEEVNVYRHTALVASISDAVFHDNPQATEPQQVALREKHIEITARTFEWVNTIIILLAIVLPIARILPKVIRKREQTLKHNLEQARKSTADANARLAAVEAQMARLDEEIGKIRAQVEEESKQDEARIKASIEEESVRIVASAEQEIAAAAAHAQRGLKAFAADLAIEQAAKQLILTPETDRALIAEFVASAGNGATNSAKTGGRN